jgi:hypothetical protein
MKFTESSNSVLTNSLFGEEKPINIYIRSVNGNSAYSNLIFYDGKLDSSRYDHIKFF